MKKFTVASLTAAIVTSAAMMFAPMSFGAGSEQSQNAIERSDVRDAGRSLEIAGRASGGWHRPPADASMDKFVVALASTR